MAVRCIAGAPAGARVHPVRIDHRSGYFVVALSLLPGWRMRVTMMMVVIGALVAGCTVMVNGKPRRIGGSDEPVAATPGPEATAGEPAPSPSPGELPATTAAVAQAPAPAPAPPPAPVSTGDCVWFPVLLMKQHEGGGTYGPMVHASDLDLNINPHLHYAVIGEFSKKTAMDTDGFECDLLEGVKTDKAILRALKKHKDHPEYWVGAHWAPGRVWQVDTDNGAPVAKSRVAIAYMRKH